MTKKNYRDRLCAKPIIFHIVLILMFSGMLIARLNAKKNQRINECLLEKICITSKKKKRAIISTLFYRELKKPKPVN